jgi:hypothetical protein
LITPRKMMKVKSIFWCSTHISVIVDIHLPLWCILYVCVHWSVTISSYRVRDVSVLFNFCFVLLSFLFIPLFICLRFRGRVPTQSFNPLCLSGWFLSKVTTFTVNLCFPGERFVCPFLM